MRRRKGAKFIQMGRVLLLTLLVMAFFVAGCQSQDRPSPTAVVAEATVAGPTPTPLPTPPVGKAVTADGELASPYPRLALAFDGGISGRVKDIRVQAGDTIAEGDVLAVLDDIDLRQDVEDAERALDRALADRARAQQQWKRDVADAEQALASAERSLTTAQLQYSHTAVEEAKASFEQAQQTETKAADEYNKVLYRPWEPQHVVDRYYEDLQSAIRERELAQLRLEDAQRGHSADYLSLEEHEEEVAQAQRKLDALDEGVDPSYDRAVEDAEVQLAEAKDALTHMHLTAPWTAMVLSVDVAPESTVGAGASVVTLLSLEDGLRFVTQNLSEQHIADIRPGQAVIVTLRTFPDVALTGQVEVVVPQTDTDQASAADARFTVRARLDPIDLNLLPGLTGRIEILVEK